MFLFTELKNEINSNLNLIKSIDDECYRLLSLTKYGWYNFKEKKEILPNSKEWKTQNYFEKNCRILDPNEVITYKIGTCWDFTIYMANYIKDKFNLQSDIYFVNDKNFRVTHSFLIFKNLKDLYIVEPTFNRKNIFGVHKITGQITKFIKNFYKNIEIYEINKCNSNIILDLAFKHELTAHKFISLFNFKIKE